jgi:uncharacterized membrane protein
MNPSSTTPKNNLAITGTISALVVLAALGTLLIRIPIPATTGYFNLGDVFVILAGLWLGPIPGMIVGAIGPTVADAIGYPQFIPATFVTKGCEGLLAGLIGLGWSAGLGRKVLAASVGAVIMVAGYFIFEAWLYPAIGQSVPFFNVTTPQAALIEVPLNLIQGGVSAAVAIGLWKAVSGYKPGKRRANVDSEER